MNFATINGRIVPAQDATVAIDNGAFRYGYGLFETMLVRDGSIHLDHYHWDRLFPGLKQLQFEIPALLTPQYLQAQVLDLVKKNNALQLCRVRLQVYAPGGGLYSHERCRPLFVIECFPVEPTVTGLNTNGLVAGIATGLHKSNDSLANLKSCNALIYALAAREASNKKWNDALITNTAGNIIESTIANIFWFKGGTLFTPPLTEGCVAGVMRRHIMNKTSVIEQPLTLESLLGADEVMLTNAIRQMRWVGEIAGTTYNNTNIKELATLVGA